MSKLIKFEVQKFKAARVIGKPITGSVKPDWKNPIPATWDTMYKDGSFDFLMGLPNRSSEHPDPVGWMGDYNPESQEFIYIIGLLTAPGTAVPEGYVYRDIPDCQMAIAWIEGQQEGGDLYMKSSELSAKARDEAGYEYDYSAGDFEMEYYDAERFGAAMKRGEKLLVLDYYSPCKKRGNP